MSKEDSFDLDGLCSWLRSEKGIITIDFIDLIDFIPEYEKWLETKEEKDGKK